MTKGIRRTRFRAYHDGWIAGAGLRGFDREREKDPDLGVDYCEGAQDGRNAYRKAMAKAEKTFGYKQLRIRAAVSGKNN